MFDWLKKVNEKKLNDYSIQDTSNLPKDGAIKIDKDTQLDGSISVSLDDKELKSVNIEVIKKF